MARIRRRGTTLPAPPAGDFAAVHVRRGDVHKRDRKRFTPDSKILGVVDALRGRGMAVHVYSEGAVEDFDEYAKRGATVHLGGSVLEAWSAFLAARCLVVARSSFSYVPAALREGGVVFEPFWHLPAAEAWVRYGEVLGNGSVACV